MALKLDTPVAETIDEVEDAPTTTEEREATAPDLVEEVSAYEFMLLQSDIY